MAYELKTRETDAKVGAFIDAVPDVRRREDARVVVKMMQEVTGEAPAMWGASIIGFGHYRYVYDSGHAGEMCRLGFSPRKTNLVFYIAATQEPSAPLLARLGKHRTGKGCLYINKLDDVHLDVLRELMKAGLAYMDAKHPPE
jgi:hypothetical protein